MPVFLSAVRFLRVIFPRLVISYVGLLSGCAERIGAKKEKDLDFKELRLFLLFVFVFLSPTVFPFFSSAFTFVHPVLSLVRQAFFLSLCRFFLAGIDVLLFFFLICAAIRKVSTETYPSFYLPRVCTPAPRCVAGEPFSERNETHVFETLPCAVGSFCPWRKW